MKKPAIEKAVTAEGVSFSAQDFRIEKETIHYQGFVTLKSFQVQHKLYAGGWGPSLRRELVMRTPAAAVLLYDPVRDEVVLVEQFRAGAIDDPAGPWMLELVAGLVEPEECFESLVKREAQEEAGLQVYDLERICEYYPSPGASDERLVLFCGHVDASAAGGIHGLAEEGEDICVKVYPRKKTVELMKQGRVNNAATIIALQWLELTRT